LPEDVRRDHRGALEVRREPQGSDARGHGVRTGHDGQRDRGRHRHPAGEAHATRVRARGGRGAGRRRRGGQGHRGDLVMETQQQKKVDPKEIQRLREETNAGVMDCKRALEDAEGNYARAKDILRERGLEKAAKKSEREAKEGVVAAYIHAGGRIGAIVEIASETDFVARGEEFQKLAQEVAMQVAAMAPASVDELLSQAYIRDASKTIKDLVTSLAVKTGENVSVRRFQRFALGE